MKNVKTKTSLAEGPIFVRMILFTLPIILTGLLQVMYNMADNIVVGRFSGDELALAAVGSTSSLTTLIVNFLSGLATGAGVVIAQAYGARDTQRTSRSIHTAVVFSVVSGVAFAMLSFALASPALQLMKTKEEVFSRALSYFRIICIGIPASTVYNFGNAALRSVGNSKTPLYILSMSGIMNVVLNLFFVIVCGMAVEGVAIATVISQYASAVAVLTVLFRSKDETVRLDRRKLMMDRGSLTRILRFGLPAGIQGSLFSISNIMLTSAVNTLPTVDVSAKTIAFNIDGLVYTATNSYLHSTMTFVGQNYGAKKPERIKKSILYALLQVTVLGIALSQLIIYFAPEVVSLYIDPTDPNAAAVSASAVNLMHFILSIYFMCGIMETLSGALRGLGNSVAPMVISIIGTCVMRVVWIYIFFPMESFNSLVGLYYCYPISYVFTIVALVTTLIVTGKSLKKRLGS